MYMVYVCVLNCALAPDGLNNFSLTGSAVQCVSSTHTKALWILLIPFDQCLLCLLQGGVILSSSASALGRASAPQEATVKHLLFTYSMSCLRCTLLELIILWKLTIWIFYRCSVSVHWEHLVIFSQVSS